MDRKNGILIDESLSEESKRQRDDVIDTGAFGMQTSGSDVVFFQGVLPEINRTVQGSEPIDKQIEMCLDQLELMLETIPDTSWTS
ncbi:endoribonuclease L-PSP [Halorubrum sp. SD690R]|uniref:endoribonuclease L-PSP n=1 Tax=Halorubrum sp. SD690R TaxID=2518117 RepID=UPI0010FA30C9|nr:endoribonuclease L-PSP [Halorubrum sp. SD690R]TKX40951.1 endoribonuclease L-PSP [Halorubrum sp. SD690R]